MYSSIQLLGVAQTRLTWSSVKKCGPTAMFIASAMSAYFYLGPLGPPPALYDHVGDDYPGDMARLAANLRNQAWLAQSDPM